MAVEDPRIGDRVSYEDQANPLRVGTIVDIATDDDFGPHQFHVRWDREYQFPVDEHLDPNMRHTETISDLRQPGWKRVHVPTVKFRAKPGRFGETNVLVDGEAFATYRKRSESYTGIGLGTYTYYDVWRLNDQPVAHKREDLLGTDSIRRKAVTEALVNLRLDEAAKTLDPEHAELCIGRRRAR